MITLSSNSLKKAGNGASEAPPCLFDQENSVQTQQKLFPVFRASFKDCVKT